MHGHARNRTRRMLLWCAATDSSFELARMVVGEREITVLSGKCIHCNRRLAVDLDGNPLGRETIEHIVPRTHGGGNALSNLAIACSRCNQGKGVRHDPRRWDDEGLQRVIATLQERRAARMRAPLEGLVLPEWAGDEEGEGEGEHEDEHGAKPKRRRRG